MPTKNQDKLGVLIAGFNGAVSTTFITGTLSIIKGKSKPIGSLTQMGTIRLGKRSDWRFPYIKDFVPLTSLDSLIFGGWDIKNQDCFFSAIEADVLKEKDIHPFKSELVRLKPMPGVFENKYVKGLNGTYIKKGKDKYDLMEQLRADIRDFKESNKLSRVIVIWCGTPEVFINTSHVHISLNSFKKGMRENSEHISPGMLYAYAAIAEDCPYINGTPNISADIPALKAFADIKKVPLAGKDFKTGQTLIKAVISSMVRSLNYNKEDGDNIDIFGWMGYPVQLKLDFLCKDPILTAPLVLDLILFSDLAKRKGLYGIQDWLAFYFKSPLLSDNEVPDHDLFLQLMKLKNTLRQIMGEDFEDDMIGENELLNEL